MRSEPKACSARTRSRAAAAPALRPPAQRVLGWLMMGLLALTLLAVPVAAQQIPTQEVISVARGQSALLPQPNPVQRVSIADPDIADAIVVSPREVLVNGRNLGSTSLIIWDQAGLRRVYSVEVTVDATALERQFRTLFPGEQVSVTAAGNMVIVSGRASQAVIARRMMDLARATGANVVDNMQSPPPQQVLLQVRFAEVSRSVLREFNTVLNARAPFPLRLEETGHWEANSISDELIRLFLFDNSGAQIEALFRNLRTTGDFRSLAEPNLLAVDGAEASFLAGGEFPFPTAQTGVGGVSNAVTIVWKEFGVRLNFTPTITGVGNIRLRVAPEVSSLDFGNAITVQGFRMPSLLSRRADTEIELRDGQTFAIAGLIDSSTLDNVTRIPLLGDLPILGSFFRSRSRRQNKTELLVLVTPRLVGPFDEAPPVPTGEPETWRWDSHLRRPVRQP